MLQLLQNLHIYCCIEPLLPCNTQLCRIQFRIVSLPLFNSILTPVLQMLSFQRVILWPLLALIFFIIYYFDKIYLVKIHFYSRTLSPGSNKSERKQRIQDNFVGDCETKIQRTRGEGGCCCNQQNN